MKIDESCINHYLARTIEDMVGLPFEYSEGSEDADHQRLITLGYVNGAIDFANRLKEVLMP